MPVSQPKRIDVPVSRPTDTRSFGIFLAGDSSNYNSSIMTRAYGQDKNPKNNSYHSQQHKCPTLASTKLLQSYISTQKPKPGKICETTEAVYQSQPKSHNNASKMSLLHSSGPQGQKLVKKSDAQCSRNGLSPDPWKREAREQLEKQQRHQAVELLEKEVLQLKAKEQRTLEESERLRRLSLEWQFQKRLKEFQQNENDHDDEEDEDSTAGTIMPQSELQSTEQVIPFLSVSLRALYISWRDLRRQNWLIHLCNMPP